MNENIERIFRGTLEKLSETGIPHDITVRFSVPNAEERLRNGLEYYCREKTVWNEDYQQIVDWLSSNKGKGLVNCGGYGTGKTLICCKIIPVLLYSGANRLMCFQCHATELGKRLNYMLQQKIVIVDDIGTEDKFLEYGNKRMAFNELVDNAERRGNLIIATTNLDIEHLVAKYGERTIDRLRGLTKFVKFTGKSLRK